MNLKNSFLISTGIILFLFSCQNEQAVTNLKSLNCPINDTVLSSFFLGQGRSRNDSIKSHFITQKENAVYGIPIFSWDHNNKVTRISIPLNIEILTKNFEKSNSIFHTNQISGKQQYSFLSPRSPLLSDSLDQIEGARRERSFDNFQNYLEGRYGKAGNIDTSKAHDYSIRQKIKRKSEPRIGEAIARRNNGGVLPKEYPKSRSYNYYDVIEKHKLTYTWECGDNKLKVDLITFFRFDKSLNFESAQDSHINYYFYDCQILLTYSKISLELNYKKFQDDSLKKNDSNKVNRQIIFDQSLKKL